MLTLAIATLLVLGTPKPLPAQATTQPYPGQLQGIDRDGRPGVVCPLKGTQVRADIAGFGARVVVVQKFSNPTQKPIEAVYTFPLPSDASVDRMRIKIDDRIVEGVIRRKEEARRIYEAAKNRGQVAGLLDQERPNIFTQSVANIMPGAEIEIEISYVQLLKYEDGQFEFMFPMVVGPRFLPASTPDPTKISPPIVPPGTRSGANIELEVKVDAGAPIREVVSVLHATSTRKDGPNKTVVSLSRKDEIPNRDFILRYRTAGEGVTSAFLTHADAQKGGFFTLVLMPPRKPRSQDIAPKEVIFVMDQSGSQRGFPIEKSKELTLKLIRTLNPDDTFNVMGFSNGVNLLWRTPRRANEDTVGEAERFVRQMEANGGTQLLPAVQAALNPKADPDRLRLVVFNTDGFVGNEYEILQEIKNHRGPSRMFTFGIGNSTNRFLIEAMSAEGRGDSETVTLAEDADKAVDRFVQRTRSPILTDVGVRFEGVQVDQVLPQAIPDVFSEKPIVVKGRYTRSGKGRVVLTGRYGGEAWSKTFDVDLPSTDRDGSAIATLWAREKVDALTREHWVDQQRGQGAEIEPAIVDLALEFGIVTQFTSFVAVEQRVVNIGGKQHTVRVPVEMADGVSYEGIFGKPAAPASAGVALKSSSLARGSVGGLGGGGAAGAASGAKPPTEAEDKAMREATAKERRALHFQTKVAKALREAKGVQTVQVWLADVEPETLAELAKHGLKVEVTDKGLKVVFGTIDAKALEALAQLSTVQRIERLS